MRMRGLGRARDGEVVTEVFPCLELAAGIGMLAGAVVAGALARWVGHDSAAVFVRGLLGALGGGLLGALAAMSWAVEPPRSTVAGPPAPPGDLWDAWVDTAADPEPEPLESRSVGLGIVAELVPERARVRPRVRTGEGGSLPLEDEVWPLLKAGQCGAVRVSGATGSGKTTALRHLAALFPPLSRTTVLDEPDVPTLAAAASRGLVLYTSNLGTHGKDLASYRLAPWGDDELIEYLLAADRTRCASVMARLKLTDDRRFLQGIPELWRIVLDRMATDESVEGGRQALRLELAARMPDPVLRARVEDACLADTQAVPDDRLRRIGIWFLDQAILNLIRHRPVGLLLAADRIAAALDGGGACDFLSGPVPLPYELVEEAAPRIATSARAVNRLRGILNGEAWTHQAMAASLLHAARGNWRPDSQHLPRLRGAYLDRALWAGLDLQGAVLAHASMVRADLCRANLDRADLERTRLHRAHLREATLRGSNLALADLSHADLTSCVADRARFGGADLSGAALEQASFNRADFWRARLDGASLRGADLAYARIEGATIKGADFTGANLEGARLRDLGLDRARFTDARFGGADLTGCHLEGMELPAADFEDAQLVNALLTGSRMPGARFLGADLRDAGLAEVEWPGICLRDADLRGASFHLGSTRSGLVQSPIACEGSRTGFYTEDFNDQDYRPPEEIRKANLCGADLRGATIDGVDFYLVDLRGARFDRGQVEHLRRCRAILDAGA